MHQPLAASKSCTAPPKAQPAAGHQSQFQPVSQTASANRTAKSMKIVPLIPRILDPFASILHVNFIFFPIANRYCMDALYGNVTHDLPPVVILTFSAAACAAGTQSPCGPSVQ